MLQTLGWCSTSRYDCKMEQDTCSIDDCETERHRAQPWCRRHYYRNLRHGSPLGVALPRPRRPKPPCRLDGCEAPASAKSLCNSHYHRLVRYGDPLGSGRSRGSCEIEGCDQAHYGNGFCQMHYHRVKRHGDPGPPERIRPPYSPICTVEGCGQPHRTKGMCDVHRKRFRRHGTTTNPPRRFLLGPDHPQWAAEPGYMTVHRRIDRTRGKAKTYRCTKCGGAASQWGYDHSDPSPIVGSEGCEYSLDISRYDPMCVVCHAGMDAEWRRLVGRRRHSPVASWPRRS